MALDIKKFISRFIEEAKDHLARLTSGLAELEKTESEEKLDVEQVNSLFRSAHTLKGSSRMLKLEPVTQIAHSLEDLLSALRDQRIFMSTQVSALLYQAVDTLTDQVEALEAVGEVAELTTQELNFCRHLSAVAENPDLLKSTAESKASSVVAELPVKPDAKGLTKTDLDKPALKSTDTVRIKLSKLEELIKLMGELVSNHAGMRELVSRARYLEKKAQKNQSNLVEIQRFSQDIRENVLSQEDLMQELHDKTLQMRMLPLGIND